MGWRGALLLVLTLACYPLLHAQKPWKQFLSIEYGDTVMQPRDTMSQAEWVFGRLKYRDLDRFRFGDSYYWSMDYPVGDRHLLEGIRRLTSIDVRSYEQAVEPDGSDDIYNWPFLYGVEVGHMDPDEAQAAQLREYLLRGGFLMVDDFHGEFEWDNFALAMNLVFPDRPIVDLEPGDSIFHTMTDVDPRLQIPSAQYIQTRRTWERDDGMEPHWRAILDDRGRIMVAICHNMDLGDAVEWSDRPEYPEEFATMGHKILTNFVVYGLTH